ncbi:MAG: hypothetical protein AAF713_08940 [Pseudomonadota bacterium]
MDHYTIRFDNKTIIKARGTVLACYPELHLMDLQFSDNAASRTVLVSALASNGEALLLDGTSLRLHHLDAFMLDLGSVQAREDYLGFFCEFVRSDEGPFSIVESVEAIPFAYQDAQAEFLEQSVGPSAIAAIQTETDDTFGQRAYVLHGMGLSEADFKTTRTGRIDILRDKTVFNDLTIRRRDYDGPFRTVLGPTR